MSLPDYNFSTPIYWTRENAPKESQTIFGNYPDPIFRNPIFLSGNTDIDINIGAGYERPNVWAMLLGKGINLGMQLGGLWLMTRGAKKNQPETQPQPLNDYQIYLQNIKSSLDIDPVTINVNPSGPVAPESDPQGQVTKRFATFSNWDNGAQETISGYILDKEITYDDNQYGKELENNEKAKKYPAKFALYDRHHNENGNKYVFQLTDYNENNGEVTLTYTIVPDECKILGENNKKVRPTPNSYTVTAKGWKTNNEGNYILPLNDEGQDIEGKATGEVTEVAVPLSQLVNTEVNGES